MAYGKVIKLFLASGRPNGLKVVDILNWSGRALAAYRPELKVLTTRDEVSQPGVYFLIGFDEELLKTTVYIGETDNFRVRIKQHLEKEFWNQTVLFTSNDDFLNKAHVKWLEAAIFDEIKDNGSIEIMNSNTPATVRLSESDQAIMQEFKDNIYLILGTLGFMNFAKRRPPKAEISSPISEGGDEEDELVLFLSRKGYHGEMVVSATNYIVKKGSQLHPEDPKYRTNRAMVGPYRKRDEYIDKGYIVTKDGIMETAQDLVFSSPSAAAQFLIGKTQSGRVAWKTKDGRTLKQIEENRAS